LAVGLLSLVSIFSVQSGVIPSPFNLGGGFYNYIDEGSGGGGAPTDAEYIVNAPNGSLSAERVLGVSNGLSKTDSSGATTLGISTTDYPVMPGIQYSAYDRAGVFYDDFTLSTLVGWASAISGTGAVNVQQTVPWSTSNGVGALRMVTTAVADVAGLRQNTNGATLWFGNGTTTLEWNVYIPVLSSGTDEYSLYVGCLDASLTNSDTDRVALYYDRTVSTNWIADTKNNGAASTPITSSVSVEAGKKMSLRLVGNAAGTSINFQVGKDGTWTDIGSIATNIPNSQARSCTPAIRQIKSVGTTLITNWADFVFGQILYPSRF